MIPQRIIDYLQQHEVGYERVVHDRAFTAQELAATMHVPGRRVAKSVIVEADGTKWIAVLPATEVVDEERLATELGVSAIRLLREPEFAGLFPDCEPGAEPPFGGLYGLPIIVESALAETSRVVFRAGSHTEAIEMRYDDFDRLEDGPEVATFGRRIASSAPPRREQRVR